MDNIKSSRERKNLSKNFEYKNQLSLETQKNRDYNLESNSESYSRNISTPAKKLRSTYGNVKISTGNKNRHIAKNDTNDEQNCDSMGTTKQYIGNGLSSPEGTDENSTDRDNVQSKNAARTAILHKREKRRKTKRKRSNQDKRLSSTRTDHEENINENRNSVKRHESLSPTSREYSDSHRNLKKKRIRTRGGGGHGDEVPITEILRKAQENNLQNQYEGPIVLQQLTTDKIYVQGRNGFSAVKIPRERIARGHRNPNSGDQTIMYPIKVAILVQKAWKNAGLIYQGLLAGMAFMHFLVIQTYFKLFDGSIGNFHSFISELYTNIFSFLLIMCIISAFDKLDLARLNIQHFKEIHSSYAKALMAIPLYIAVFFLHLTTIKLDVKLTTLHHQNPVNLSTNNNTVMTASAVELNTWKDITLIKNGITVVAWILIALGPQNDMLLSHLQTLEQYAQNNS